MDRNAAQQNFNQMGKSASEFIASRAQKNGIACVSEKIIRERPTASILMVAGRLLGRFCKCS